MKVCTKNHVLMSEISVNDNYLVKLYLKETLIISQSEFMPRALPSISCFSNNYPIWIWRQVTFVVEVR